MEMSGDGSGRISPFTSLLFFQIMGFEGEGKVNQTIYFPSPIDKMFTTPQWKNLDLLFESPGKSPKPRPPPCGFSHLLIHLQIFSS